jgi:hypothetical protein
MATTPIETVSLAPAALLDPDPRDEQIRALKEELANAEKAADDRWAAALDLADWDGGVFHYDGRIYPWPSGFVPNCPATWEEQIKPFRTALSDLVAALPKCGIMVDGHQCGNQATRSWERGRTRYCDEHGPLVPEYPRAAPLRRAIALLNGPAAGIPFGVGRPVTVTNATSPAPPEKEE